MKLMDETLAEGIACHQQGEVVKAVDIYRRILEEEPEHADALHLLGVCAMQLGQFDQSIELIGRALEIQPGTATYYNNLTAAYHRNSELDKAEECCLKAIELQSDFADAHNSLGNLYREKNNLDKAKQQYLKVISIDSNHSGAINSLKQVEEELSSLSEVDSTTATDEVSSESQFNSKILNDNFFQAGKKHVLHVGCGGYNPKSLNERYKNEEWKEIRLDINKDVRPDILASLTDMSAVESNSVDAVWSSHNVEHLYAHDVPIALGEFLRVLKPGGHALITLPDLQQIAEYIIEDRLDEVIYESPIGPITGVDFIFGHGESIAKGNHYMQHLTGFTATSLKNCLEKAGFVRLNAWFTPFNLWVEAFKP
jgi:tetratricopeptide (TPR) repeat protein